MNTPYISREDVGRALSSLIHTVHKPEAAGLQHLLLVDLLVSAPDMPSGPEVRNYAIRELLVMEITRALSEQRMLFHLDLPNEHASLDQARVALSTDRLIGAAELMAWTTLYYRFVRSDLDISVGRLADILMVDPRTITRYNDEGTELLTRRLIKAEQLARRDQLERRLNAALPSSVPVRMVGRDELLHSVNELLPNLSPCHLLVTGEAGIGKTTFVQELLRRQIAAGRLDQIIWLDQPKSVEFVRQQLSEILLRESEEVTLRDYLLVYRVAIVLDDVELVGMDRVTLSEFLRDVSAALVFLICRDEVLIEGIEAYLALPELDSEDADTLAYETFRLRHSTEPELWNGITLDLYAHVGGNPLALKLAAMWEDSEDWNSLQTEIQERLLDKVFNRLDVREQFVWCALALLPRPASVSDLTTIWALRYENIERLMHYSLIEQSDKNLYMLVGGAREYIKARYAEGRSEIARLFQQVITGVQLASEAFSVVENVLVTGFPALDQSRRAEWIRWSWVAGLRRGHWARWRAILGDYLAETENAQPELRTAYGVCLRRLSDWNGSERVFYSVVADCGRMGNFAEQARALLEWSILDRYKGRYDEAQALIAQVKRYAQRAHDDELLAALAFQEAQILIQQGNGAAAEQILTTLSESALVLTLHSEARLSLDQYESCRSLALRALELIRDDQVTEASLYTIIGRSYERQRDYEQAQYAFTDALTLLERLDAVFALARAQTNLASALITLKRFNDAEMLLTRAEQVQTRLGDQVGLRATLHNQTILRGNFAR